MNNVYKIPAKDSFIDSLAAGLLNNPEYSNILDKTLIILPNQISCKFLYDSLLQQCDNSLTLPKIIPIADINNPDDPFKFLPPFLSMPESIEIDEIKIFIYKIFSKWQNNNHQQETTYQKIDFCTKFLNFFLELEEMECDIKQLLKNITINDLTIYHQLLIKFLKYFIEEWNSYKLTHHKTSFIENRNNIVKLRTKHISQLKSFNKIILAGSSGINQCTRNLIKKITEINNGIFIFHDIIPLTSSQITQNHPNYLNKSLLKILPESIKTWYNNHNKTNHNTKQYIETDNIQQEATLISNLIKRNKAKSLHTTIITNNTYLRNLILLKLENYLEIQQNINANNPRNLLYLTINKILEYANDSNPTHQKTISFLKQYHSDNIEQIEFFLNSITRSAKNSNLHNLITEIFSFLSTNTQEPATKVDGLIDGQIQTKAGGINRTHQKSKSCIPNSNLKQIFNNIKPFTTQNIEEFKKTIFFLTTTNTNIFFTNKHFTIIHPKEARLKNFANTIIADISENSWQANISNILNTAPFIKSQNLKALRNGQIANDFLRHKHSNHLIITKSRFSGKKNNTSYFWLKEFLSHNIKTSYYNSLEGIPYTLDNQKPTIVTPDTKHRIHDFSVTQIEKLIKNPYSIYALKTLKLKSQTIFNFEKEAQFFGTLIHDIIDQYIKNHKTLKEQEHQTYMLSLFHKNIAKTTFRKSIIKAWFNRFNYISNWIINQHNTRIKDTNSIYSEHTSTIAIGNINLKAKIDRIEEYDNHLKIIDYKTGIPPTNTNIKQGLSPQLILEAYICLKLFKNLKTDNISLEYWELKGKKFKEGIIHSIKDISQTIENTEKNIKTILQHYQHKNTPIIAFPNANHIPKYDDYFHLARQNK